MHYTYDEHIIIMNIFHIQSLVYYIETHQNNKMQNKQNVFFMLFIIYIL
jgi:hypothetical protein